MNKFIKYSVFFIHLSFVICYLSFPANAVSSNELVNNAGRYDGQTIEYQGEVIGDIMIRRNHAWVNVNDGGRAIGIFANKDLVRNIKRTGGYRYVGDSIKVIGTFNRACPEHGGDLDIHAREIYVVKEGYMIDRPVEQRKLIIAVILFLGILAALIIPEIIKRLSP